MAARKVSSPDGVVMAHEGGTEAPQSGVTRIVAWLVAFSTVAAFVISFLQYMSPAQPVVVTMPPAEVSARSEADIQREVEKARRETLEKVLKEVVAAPAKHDGGSVAVPEDRPSVAAEPPRASVDRPSNVTSIEPARSTPVELPSTTKTPPTVELDATGCILLSNVLAGSIPVKKGSRVCSRHGGDQAHIVDVSANRITYKVNGGFNRFCDPTELCVLEWSSGEVLFRVRTNSEQSADIRAELIPPSK